MPEWTGMGEKTGEHGQTLLCLNSLDFYELRLIAACSMSVELQDCKNA